MKGVKVFGPINEERWDTFVFVRTFENGKTKLPFTAAFKIINEKRNNKWHHTSITGAGVADVEGWELCKEGHFIPRRDCACIRACKEHLSG